MLAVAMLGVSPTFLTQVNLQIAESTRSNTIARYNAEAGLDTALAFLARAFKLRKGELPANLTEPQSIFVDTPDYALAAYQRFDSTRGMVPVRGRAPSVNVEYVSVKVEYVVEARFIGAITALA